jgi:hypothetical protein
MIIVYQPQGGDAHRWDLTEIRILATEAEAVERVTDLDWQAARAKVVRGSMLALRAVAWVLMKRTDTTLRYGQFSPAADELSWEYSQAERAEIRKAVAENADLGDEERAALLAEFDEADALLDGEPPAVDEDPESVPKASADEASPTDG